MEQKRFILFFALSMAIWLSWFHLVVPVMFPGLNQPRKPAAKVEKPLEIADNDPDAPVDALKVANAEVAEVAHVPQENKPQIPNHPVRELVLGPPDADGAPGIRDTADEYLLSAGVSSLGASIDYAELTDKKRYPAFGRRDRRIPVLGSEPFAKYKTFALSAPEIDKQLGKLTLDQISWEFVPEADQNLAERVATFRIVSPDGHWEITKRFELTQLTLEQIKKANFKDQLVAGYEIKLKLKIRNLTRQPLPINYSLQGPVGVPLEDTENTYKYRDIRVGFLRPDGTVEEKKLSASQVVSKEKANKAEIWTRELKYIGVDVLYFAALVMPGKDQLESSKAIVSWENTKKDAYSDVSVQLLSSGFVVPGLDQVEHEYTMFAGPKRKELMGELSAQAVMDYGWFDSICRGMVWLLNLFHRLGLSYGLAIICLTALVRTLMMPISKHQAANAEKMKELQPKIAAKQKELEARYGKNTEEYMQAAQELSKEQLGLMLSGCLPVFLQLPIFIALYRAIGSSIELRMEPFLWFENLASPDAMFAFPGPLPFLGWTHFNLLPCISIALMFMHQKLTMPKPTNEEQAQQQVMMNVMMVVMGATFYRVPSGLCLYFIATNVWSMTERWVFQHWKGLGPARLINPDPEVPPSLPPVAVAGPQKSGPDKPSALGELWSRLQQAADNQVSATRQLDNTNASRADKKKKKR